MRTKIKYLVIVLLLINCKEKPEVHSQKGEELPREEKATPSIPPEVMELGTLAGVVFSDLSDVHEFIAFKQIDENERVSTIDMKTAITLYRKMTKSEGTFVRPIFELKGTDTAILPLEGIGFGGAIWAKVLVDRNTLKIRKIEFEHQAESEGYGAAMTQSSFEDKFVGARIDLEKNTFTLQRNKEISIDDGASIDGIAGATMTSQATLEMVNDGLKKYKGYLVP